MKKAPTETLGATKRQTDWILGQTIALADKVKQARFVGFDDYHFLQRQNA